MSKIRAIPVIEKFDHSSGTPVLIGTFVRDSVYGRHMNYDSATPGAAFAGPDFSGIWEDVYEFTAELELVDETMTMYDPIMKRSYPMFSADFARMVKRSVMNYGRVYGDWEFVKKNTSIGIRLK